MTIASSARRNALTSSAPCTRTAAEMLSSGLWGCSWARNHNRSWAKDRGQLSDFALRGIACRRLKTLLCRGALDSQLRATSLRPAASNNAPSSAPAHVVQGRGPPQDRSVCRRWPPPAYPRLLAAPVGHILRGPTGGR